jgi:hypothetical protein
MNDRGPSLAGRTALAVALTIGFYTLALLIAAALIGLLHYERCAPSPVQARLEGRRPEVGRLGA